MNSLKTILEGKNIIIPLRNYAIQDLSTGWEVKTIVENRDFFKELYSRFPLTKINNLDDYYLYLLTNKLASMKEVIPLLLHEEHKVIISSLCNSADKTLAGIKQSEVIKYINKHTEEIFENDNNTHDIRFVTLDIIAKYCNGIDKSVFEFLCQEYAYLIIDRYEQFEKIFEQTPELFDILYPTGRLEEINALRFEKTLEIWQHILNKGKSCLKEAVKKCITVLEHDVKHLSETATIDNIMQVEGTIREFHMFLQRIQSPKANVFAEHAKKAATLLAGYIANKGQSFRYEIPIGEIISRWKETDNWEVRLLSLTHQLKNDADGLSVISHLAKTPEAKHPLIDFVSTNVPTDDYYTMSHQQMLSVIASVGTGTMVGIIRNQDTLLDYLNLVASAISLVVEQLKAEGEQLQQDIEMLSALVQMVANNLEIKDDAMHGICYGASMYTCAFSEKLLRILYRHLAKDEKFVPLNSATFGQLLNVNNSYMVDVFGESHIRNLSFFLQQASSASIGQNIRNALAHWANVSPEAMTPLIVAKMLWIFTDILNTVFWYCLKDVIERNESDDQL